MRSTAADRTSDATVGRARRLGRSTALGRFVRPLLSLALLAVVASSVLAAGPKNVIICIGDGMGPEHVKAARCYLGSPLSFETLPHQGEATTRSANNRVTDSAASGTAMATGHKVNNDVVSVARPPNDEYFEAGSDMETTLEHYQSLGKSVGLVTTAFMTDATPSAFGAHTIDRDRSSEIVSDYLYRSRPTLFFGGGGRGMSPDEASAAGYTVVTNRAGLLRLATDNRRRRARVSGQFGIGSMPYEHDGVGAMPHLSEMTVIALDLLDDDPDGLFLMVEGALIDKAAHDNKTERNILETVEFSNAVQKILDWAEENSDTLIIVTADHECGGLRVVADKGKGNFPEVEWSSTDHTGVNVPVYAQGPNADLVEGVIDNTDIHKIATAELEPAAATAGEAAVSAP